MLSLIALGLIAAWRLAAGTDPSPPSALATGPRSDAAADELAAELTREEGRSREALAGETTVRPPSEASSSDLRVRVVRAGSGQPIPEATVWHSDWSRIDVSTDAGVAALVEMSSDIERQLHALGDATTTDAQGYATVPWPAVGHGLGLGCRDGEEYGYLQVDLRRSPPPDCLRLEVGIDTTLEVRTVDAVGAQISGVPIGLRPCSADPSEKPAQFQCAGETRAPDGVLVFAHFQCDPRYHGDPAPVAFEACAMVPGMDVIARTAGLPLGRQCTVLALPRTGSVHVQVRDPHGHAVPGRFAVGIQRVPRSEEERERTRRGAALADTASSEVTFPHVALNTEFTVWVGPPLPASQRTLVGPTDTQREVDVVLELSTKGAIFTGRAVDETGAPLGERYLEFSASNGPTDDYGRVRTDAQGYFLFAVKPVVLRRPLEAFHLELLRGRIERTGTCSDLSHLASVITGSLELGDVVFSPAPVLAAGRVLRDGSITDLRPELYLEANRGNGRWRGVSATALWSEDGFELRGPRPNGRLRICARSRDHASATSQEIENGATGLMLELQTGASLELSSGAPDEN